MFLAQLLNCGGGVAPYFVDTTVDEPTVVRVPPLRSISPEEWGVENIFHRFLFPGSGSCQKYFPGHEINGVSSTRIASGSECDQYIFSSLDYHRGSNP